MPERGLSTDLSYLPSVDRAVELVGAAADREPRSAAVARLETAVEPLECSACGYGIVRSAPPERCPMCQSEDAWLYTSRRPFSRPPDGVLT